MGRPRRSFPAGTIAHVVNRAVDRHLIFHKRGDYQAFLDLLEEGRQKPWVEILGYCVMPNHWHLVLRALVDNGISLFMKWLTATHVLRYRTYYETLGLGHLYQGRFRANVIESDTEFLTVLCYVEANAAKAGLVNQAEDWEWSSGYERTTGIRRITAQLPVTLPHNWGKLLNPNWPEPEDR